jgi:pimeloyl-ACP methyl ester carboxylesterase
VLVLQGADDQTLDGATQGKAIAQALGDRAKYVEFAGVGHVPLLSEPGALRAMLEFVNAHAPGN